MNSAFPFPTYINLHPYTKEGLTSGPAAAAAAGGRPLAYYNYELAGVVVHTGTTDSGHYYSYIKDQWSMPTSAGDDAAAAAACRWLEFNDSEVTEFSASRIDAECFGGSTTTHDFNVATNRLHTEESVNPKSAYMLVYRRTQPLGEVGSSVKCIEEHRVGRTLSADVRDLYSLVHRVFRQGWQLAQELATPTPGSAVAENGVAFSAEGCAPGGVSMRQLLRRQIERDNAVHALTARLIDPTSMAAFRALLRGAAAAATAPRPTAALASLGGATAGGASLASFEAAWALTTQLLARSSFVAAAAGMLDELAAAVERCLLAAAAQRQQQQQQEEEEEEDGEGRRAGVAGAVSVDDAADAHSSMAVDHGATADAAAAVPLSVSVSVSVPAADAGAEATFRSGREGSPKHSEPAKRARLGEGEEHGRDDDANGAAAAAPPTAAGLARLLGRLLVGVPPASEGEVAAERPFDTVMALLYAPERDVRMAFAALLLRAFQLLALVDGPRAFLEGYEGPGGVRPELLEVRPI